MKYSNKKIIVLILIVAVMLNGLVLSPRTAQAQSIGDVSKIIGAGAAIVGACVAWSKIQDGALGSIESGARQALEAIGVGGGTINTILGGGTASGSSVPTEDVEARQEQSKTTCLTILRDYAISNLKKRLLDTITDETIRWIQGEGEPRFVTNPGQLLRDSADAALGDTIQQLGYGDLCYSSSRSRLVLQLETPVFSERVSCTLTDVLGNLNTSIDNFRNDFRNGGWIAYQETMKLQNNRWGQELLAMNELHKNREERQSIAEYEASVGDGFLSQKRCLEWEKVAGENTGEVISGEDFYKQTPSNDDGSISNYTGSTDYPAGSQWKCTNPQTITPGSTVGQLASDALGADFDYIINASDVGTFTAAIVDAAINRLARETSEGLSGIFTNDSRGGNGATCADIPDELSDLRQRCQELQGDIDSNDVTGDDIDPTNGGNDGNSGGNDGGQNDIINSYIEMEDGHELDVNESHTHTASFDSNDSGRDWVVSWILTDPNGESVEQTSPAFLDGDIENEVGYTFTPTQTGEYSLTLTVSSIWQASGEISDWGQGTITVIETVN